MQEGSGRVAVITGGARGLGKAFGQALAARGVHVGLVDRDPAVVQSAAADIRAGGNQATAYAADVTDAGRIGEIMADIATIHGGIDILINNAGLHSDEFSKPIGEMGVEKIKKMFDVNIVGVVICTLAARAYIAKRHDASVINISSAAAHMATTAYGASKLAVAGLTITFAREMATDGIRVNAISPGLIRTETIRTELPVATADRLQAMQFLAQEGKEQDIVDAMLFLTSGNARFITGETLRVTGGMAAGV